MTDLKRWAEDGASDSVLRLLEAASNERPSEASLAKSLSVAALGIGTLVGSSSASGAAIGAAAKTTLLAGTAWIKTGVFVAAFAVAATGGVYVASSRPPITPQPSKPVSRVAVPSSAPRTPEFARATAPAPPPVSSASAPPRLAPTPKTRAGDTPRVEDADQLAEEVRWVDQARAAVASGRSAEALRMLDTYDSRYPSRGFAPESLYLRMRALLALGRGDEARNVASRLERSYPATPQAARARELLKESIP
jgi:hypothetical protein